MKYVAYYGNLYECPIGRRLTTCPIYRIKNQPFPKKFRWFEDLKTTEKDDIVSHHVQCVRERFKNNISQNGL